MFVRMVALSSLRSGLGNLAPRDMIGQSYPEWTTLLQTILFNINIFLSRKGKSWTRLCLLWPMNEYLRRHKNWLYGQHTVSCHSCTLNKTRSPTPSTSDLSTYATTWEPDLSKRLTRPDMYTWACQGRWHMCTMCARRGARACWQISQLTSSTAHPRLPLPYYPASLRKDTALQSPPCTTPNICSQRNISDRKENLPPCASTSGSWCAGPTRPSSCPACSRWVKQANWLMNNLKQSNRETDKETGETST